MAILDRRGATVSATDAPSSSTPNPDLAIKTAARLATTSANINLLTFGLGVLDGVQLLAGDRVLVKDQTDATQNGIYNASTGVWALSSDFQNNSQVADGLQVLVTDGAGNARTRWMLATANPVLLGTSAIAFLPLREPVVFITDLPGVDASGATDSAAAIRAYIDAQPAGANIVLEGTQSTNVLMDTVRNGAAIDMVGANATKTLTILGVGWTLSTNGDFTKPQGTIFKLGPNFPTTADFYRHQPNGTLLRGGVRFKDFVVVPSGGVNSTPRGRHGFFFDGSASLEAYIERLEIDNVYVDNMATGYSLYSKGLDGGEGVLAGALITNNMMMQIRAENLGDDCTIEHNLLGVHATDDVRNFGIYYYCVSGATTPRIRDNYIFSFQGFIEDDGSINALIEGNECEISAGTNNAGFLIRLTGSKAAVTGFSVAKNRISQNVALATTSPIVVATATGGTVADNWIATPSDYPHIVLQAAASNVRVEGNQSWVNGVLLTQVNVSYAGSAFSRIRQRIGDTAALTNAPSVPESGYVTGYYSSADGRFHDLDHAGGFGTTVKPTTAAAHNFANGISTAGAISYAQPAVADLTGFGTGVAAALAVNIGSAGAPVLFNGALGTPSSGTATSLTGLPISTGLTGAGSGVLAALAVNVSTAGSVVVNGGALGTPSAGVATNLTGTAAGLTAGHVTTNANLTGDVTSVGNATTLAAGNAGNLNSGTLLAARMPALTGDATTVAGAVAVTVTKINGVDQTAAWTPYTPTFSAGSGAFATAGNAPVASGSYRQIGKTTHFKAKLVVGAAGVGTASVSTILSLPFAAAATTGCYATGRENQTSGSPLVGWQQTSTANITVTTNASSFASGNNTTIEVSGTYEAA